MEFNTVYVYIHELTNVLNQEEKSPKDIVDIVYEVITFSFELPHGSLYDGGGTAVWEHPRICIPPSR